MSEIERLLKFRIPREDIEGFETTQHLNTTNLESNNNQRKKSYRGNKQLRKKLSDNKKSPWRRKIKSPKKEEKNKNQRKQLSSKKKKPFKNQSLKKG